MKYSSDKNYIYYSGTNIPVNKLGIQNQKEIDELEAQLFLKTYEHFHTNITSRTIFNKKYLKDLHAFAFSKLYSWAGEYRSSNISKGNAVFCQARYLDEQMRRFFTEFGKENHLMDYRNKSPEEFAEKIAYFMCELIALHPFNELNGRTIRLFFDMIAVYNGYEYINYDNISAREDNKFIQASKHCMNKDCKPMERIILKGLKKAK